MSGHRNGSRLQRDLEGLEQLVHRCDLEDLAEEGLSRRVEHLPVAERNTDGAVLHGVPLGQLRHHLAVAVEPRLGLDGPVDGVGEEEDPLLERLLVLHPLVVLDGDEGSDAVVGVVNEVCHLVPPRVNVDRNLPSHNQINIL